MKKVQNNRHNMHIGTQSVLNKNEVTLISIPGYREMKAKIDNSIAKEDELAGEQLIRMTFRALPKNLARKKVSEFTLDLASKLEAIALMAGNYSLLEAVKLTATYISRVSDVQLERIIANVFTYANENILTLAGYGVTAETLAEGAALLKDYNAEILQLAKIKNELTVITQRLEKQLRATLAILYFVDAIIETKRVSNPELYSMYWIARAKRNSACTKLSVKGKVFDEVTSKPLPGAILTVVSATTIHTPTTADEPVRKIRIRSANGGFRIRLLTSGKYIIKVTYNGYIASEFIVYFNEGVLTQVELPLSKIA